MTDRRASESPVADQWASDRAVLHEAKARTPGDTFRTRVSVPGHEFLSDAPGAIGRTGGEHGEAPSPMALLTAALASCSTMTVRSYAQRKGWPLEEVAASVRHLASGGDQPERFMLEIAFKGELSDEQLAALETIAGKCPVHKALASATKVEVRRVDPA